jgi:hypothetical protein
MEHGCVPIRRMPTAFAVPSQQALPLSETDRAELDAHYKRQEADRKRKAATAINAYWEKQRKRRCPSVKTTAPIQAAPQG